MTLFDTATEPLIRAAKPLEPGTEKPRWNKYAVKTPQRCDECCQVALESLNDGKGFVGIKNARFSRRQDGVTRLYCHAHASAQRDEDRIQYNIREM